MSRTQETQRETGGEGVIDLPHPHKNPLREVRTHSPQTEDSGVGRTAHTRPSARATGTLDGEPRGLGLGGEGGGSRIPRSVEQGWGSSLSPALEGPRGPMARVQTCPRVHGRQWNAEVTQAKHTPKVSDICPEGLLTRSGTDPLQ